MTTGIGSVLHNPTAEGSALDTNPRSEDPSSANASSANSCVYIHEFIDIIGHQRANYMHHMTANWSPGAQERRGQSCYGVWAVLGSTGRWPQVVNMWEENGFEGLASSFEAETVGPGAQDPVLERWWAAAASFRSGGVDRIMVPRPWSPPIATLCSGGGGVVYAHELVKVDWGRAAEVCESARADGATARAEHGWRLIGAFTTAMRNDDEALLLWAIDAWSGWASGEAAHLRDTAVLRWRSSLATLGVRSWERILMTDAPLAPLRTGRQPRTSDQTDWVG